MLLASITVSAIWISTAIASQPCSVCLNAEASITTPEKEIHIQGFEFINNCQTLSDLTPALFQQESNECTLVQSIGTLCGCPKKKNACHLCPDGLKAEYGWRELAFLADRLEGVVPTCELVEAGLHSYDETDSYCDGSQLILAEYCGCGAKPGSQPAVLEEQQKCHLCPGGSRVPFPNKTIDILDFPFQTCGQLEEATLVLFDDKFLSVGHGIVGYNDNNCFLMRQLSTHCGCESFYEDPCPICKVDNTYEVPYPEKRVDPSLTKFFMRDLELSCGILGDIAMSWSATHPDHRVFCGALQGIGTECGCTLPATPACNVCPTSLPQKSAGLPLSDVAPYNLATCGMISVAFMFVEDGDLLPLGSNGGTVDFECRTFQYSGYICGCNDGLFTYWGAETAVMQKAASWTQRGTAILSLCGSIAIIIDILTRNQRQQRGMYYQIMVSLSMFDMFSSVAWGLGSVPTHLTTSAVFGIDPSLIREGAELEMYGSHGNDASCKAQGFLLHLGFTSILYNVALSYFYKLSVVDGWRDNDFTPRYKVLLLVIPAVIGSGIALAAIPFVTSTPIACSIGSYRDPGGWAKLIGLFYLPYGPAFIFIPLNTWYIYSKVRAQSREGNRWRMSNFDLESTSVRSHSFGGTRGSGAITLTRARQVPKTKMETLVFWQSCWYVVAFFASYAVFLVAFAMDGWAAKSYWLYILLSILTPMQGFFNGCVYFRIRIIKWISSCGQGKQPRPRFLSLQFMFKGLIWLCKMPYNLVLHGMVRPIEASSSGDMPTCGSNLDEALSSRSEVSSANLSQPTSDKRKDIAHLNMQEEEKVEEVLSLNNDSLSAESQSEFST